MIMDGQRGDSWDVPSWTQETIDPSWLSSFDTLDALNVFDPAQDAFIQPSKSSHNDLASMSSLQTSGVGTYSPPIVGAFPSPDCTLDAASCGAMSHYEHSLEQRQHSLPRRRSKYLLRRSEGGKVTNPIMISRGSPRLGESLAMQRWQNSPPEEEAASLSAIYNALESRSSSKTVDTDHTQHTDAFYKHRGHSSTTSIDSGASESSLRSGNSSQSATSKSNRRSQTPRIRSRAKGKAKNMDAADRIFKCTFCCDTFKHKYDWSRHEKSLHLNMEEWICAPHGASAVLPLTGRVHCAYCSALDPTPEHLQQHNHSACSDGSSTPRVFRRKDHLVQHLRLVHGLDTLPLIDDWKVESTIPVVSRCGFCNITLNSWNERTDHLGAHFRNGKTMADWHGEHDFDPVVTARLTHVYPPYLIASQSLTLVPFSATDPTAIDHTKQLLSRIGSLAVTPSSPNLPASTDCQVQTSLPSDAEPLPTQQELHTVVFADMLTRHLSHFARQQMLAGIIPTDEMFQRESRRLLYQDGEDEWNQTVADSPEWLQEFRQRTGFGREDDARIC